MAQDKIISTASVRTVMKADFQIQRRVASVDTNVDWSDDIVPVLQRIYQNREVENSVQLDYQLKRLEGFDKLKGIDQAVDRLVESLEQQQRILIVGDFDVILRI